MSDETQIVSPADRVARVPIVASDERPSRLTAHPSYSALLRHSHPARAALTAIAYYLGGQIDTLLSAPTSPPPLWPPNAIPPTPPPFAPPQACWIYFPALPPPRPPCTWALGMRTAIRPLPTKHH